MAGRRPTPRRPPSRPSDLSTTLLCLFVLSLLAVAAWIGLAGSAQEAEEGQAVQAKVTHDSLVPTYTYDGEVIRWYVLVDPDTGVQYLVNDRGGCCPRLGTDGEVMGIEKAEAEEYTESF